MGIGGIGNRQARRGELLATTALSGWLVLFTAGALAQTLPSGGVVAGGSATITQSSATRLDINQTSERAVINWTSFSIGAGYHVDIRQPGAGSASVQQVVGQDPSRIFGQLTSNGRVIIANPNGIWFGAGARVDVAGLVASTATLSAPRVAEFIAGGPLAFDTAGNSAASIVNDGTITVAESGIAAFVAPGVVNAGLIAARLGRVQLAAGNRFTLDLNGDGLVHLVVDDKVLERALGPDGQPLSAAVLNSGRLSADGGTVLLSAQVARGVVDNVIDTSGFVEARAVQVAGGEIILSGGDGSVAVSGTLDASGAASGQTGGLVKVLGEQVALKSGATVDVSGDAGGGTALIGGNYQGKGPEANARTTTVAAGATIDADATEAGKGGTVVVWADDATIYLGSITARGGATGGDGGFVEVSGKQTLVMKGPVNTSAPFGRSGTLLLDPINVTISSNVSQNEDCTTVPGTCSPTATGARINNDDLVGYLANNDVIVTTTASGADPGQAGTIIVGVTNVIWSSNHSLTLQAASDITVNGNLESEGNGGITLTAGGAINANGFIQSTGTGNILLQATGAANINGVVETASGNNTVTGNSVYIGSDGQLHSHGGGTVKASTATTFTNDNDVGFLVSGGSRWLVYASDFSKITDNANAGAGLSYQFKEYNKAALAAPTPSTGNGYLFTQAPILTPTLNAGSATRVYDGNAAGTGTTSGLNISVTGWINSDTAGSVSTSGVTATYTGTSSKDVGSGKEVTLGGIAVTGVKDSAGTHDVYGYRVSDITANIGSITARPVTLTGSRTYNGNTDAAAAILSFSNNVDGANLTLSGTGTLASKNAGAQALTSSGGALAGLSLGGAAASNYTLAGGSGSVTVNQLAVTLSGSRTYDATTGAAASILSIGNVIGSDAVTVASGSGTLASKDVGARSITALGTLALGGADASNYTLTGASGSVTINAATLTVTPNAVSTTYAGTTLNNTTYSQTLGSYTISGYVGGEDATSAGIALGGALAFNGLTTTTVRNAGSYSIGSGTLSMTSTANNYVMSYTNPSSNAYVIAPKALTITAPSGTALTKTYDGTTSYSGTITVGALSGFVGAETVTAGATGAYNSKDVATANQMNVTYTLADGTNGGLASNYSLASGTIAGASIAAAPLTITPDDASRVFGAANPAFTASYGGLVGGDTSSVVSGLSLTTLATSASPVGAYAITAGGASAANYTISYGPDGTLTVTAAPAVASDDAVRASLLADHGLIEARPGVLTAPTLGIGAGALPRAGVSEMPELVGREFISAFGSGYADAAAHLFANAILDGSATLPGAPPSLHCLANGNGCVLNGR